MAHLLQKLSIFNIVIHRRLSTNTLNMEWEVITFVNVALFLEIELIISYVVM